MGVMSILYICSRYILGGEIFEKRGYWRRRLIHLPKTKYMFFASGLMCAVELAQYRICLIDQVLRPFCQLIDEFIYRFCKPICHAGKEFICVIRPVREINTHFIATVVRYNNESIIRSSPVRCNAGKASIYVPSSVMISFGTSLILQLQHLHHFEHQYLSVTTSISYLSIEIAFIFKYRLPTFQKL